MYFAVVFNFNGRGVTSSEASKTTARGCVAGIKRSRSFSKLELPPAKYVCVLDIVFGGHATGVYFVGEQIHSVMYPFNPIVLICST